MNKYKLIIFDFDGTLVDTSNGIYESHRYVLQQLGYPMPTEEQLIDIIGSSLPITYKEKFNISEEDIPKAIKLFRDRYDEICISSTQVYPDIRDVLEEIKANGVKTAIATLKYVEHATRILKATQLYDYIDIIFGSQKDTNATKKELLKKCINVADVGINETVLIGDTLHDYNGADDTDIDFIGVTYGLGFSKVDYNSIDIKWATSPKDIIKLLFN